MKVARDSCVRSQEREAEEQSCSARVQCGYIAASHDLESHFVCSWWTEPRSARTSLEQLLLARAFVESATLPSTFLEMARECVEGLLGTVNGEAMGSWEKGFGGDRLEG